VAADPNALRSCSRAAAGRRLPSTTSRCAVLRRARRWREDVRRLFEALGPAASGHRGAVAAAHGPREPNARATGAAGGGAGRQTGTSGWCTCSRTALKLLWRYGYIGAAPRAWTECCGWAVRSRIPALVTSAMRLKARLAGILAHCRHPLHTGFLEGINNRSGSFSTWPTASETTTTSSSIFPRRSRKSVMNLFLPFLRTGFSIVRADQLGECRYAWLISLEARGTRRLPAATSHYGRSRSSEPDAMWWRQASG
jgi:hypothetical protein